MTLIAGIVAGLILAIPARLLLIRYSEHSLPPTYTGPKVVTWEHGQKITSSRMYRCGTCGNEWPSPLNAGDCADQDALEEDDRRNGRLFRSNTL